MPREFTDEQIELFRKTFDLFDSNETGYIRTKDVGKLIRSIGFCPSSKDLESITRQFKRNNDSISFDDFLMVISGLKCTVSPETLQAAITTLDKDNTGNIDVSLFKEILTSIGEPMNVIDVLELFKYLDIDENDTTVDAQKLFEKLSSVSNGL